MDDETKTKEPIDELTHLRHRVADLEAGEAGHRLAEQALREAQALHLIIMENFSDPIFITDDDGRFIFICPNVPHILGYPMAEIQALGNISKLVGDRLFNLAELKKQREIHNLKRVLVDKAGRERSFLVTVKRISVREDAILFICHDITERKQIEEELRQLNTELTAIHTIAVAVGQSLELDHIVKAALDKVLELTGAAAGRIKLYDYGNGRNDRLTELVVEQEVGYADPAEKTEWARLNIPIKVQDQVLGELALFNRSPRQWADQDVYLLTTIGYEMGMGIANARLFAAVEQQSRQLQTLSMRLVEAEEAERRRLARELHDQVGQSLTAMGINLDIMRTLLPTDIPEELISRLEDMRRLVTQTTKRVRQVMVDLRPEMLDDYGILAALHWSAERFTQRTGISAKVEGEEAASRLPMQVENVLYRVAQEALTNVAKHAQATRVTVNLKVDSDMVTLVVTDDGVGFTPGRRTCLDEGQHWGLELMAERVEGMRGRFCLESAPGQGTRISVEVPR
ncbi:MAG: ATP-binding protein [Chloroflexota bacterium]